MKRNPLLFALAVAVLAPGLASAQSFDQGDSIKSALHDTSNAWSSRTEFVFYYNRSASDADQFINGINVGGSASDPSFGFNTDFESLNGSVFGQVLTGDFSNTYTLANRFGDVDAGIANGFYDFSFEILGGETETSTDVLATFDFEVEVIDSFLISATATLDNAVVGPDQTTNLEMTVSNSPNGQNTFTANSWYVTSGTNSAYNAMPFAFAGNWFGDVIAPGQTLTDAHSNYTPNGSTPLGFYNAYGGIIGGLYDGDAHYYAFDAPQFEVVPEPATLALLALAPLALRRRKK